jgi:hypothetical protein
MLTDIFSSSPILSTPINFWSMTEICLNFILDTLIFFNAVSSIGKESCANIYYDSPWRFGIILKHFNLSVNSVQEVQEWSRYQAKTFVDTIKRQ